MEYKKIKVNEKHEKAVLEILLDAPKGNILDSVMMSEIVSALERVGPDTKLVLFGSTSKHFSFGASVEEHVKEKAPSMLKAFHGIFRRLIDISVPTASVVRGQCLGGGMELAIICNFILASDTAVFGQPEIKLGVFPPPASVILPMKVGQSVADRWVLTGCNIKAEEARASGLVMEVHPDSELDSAVEAFVTQQLLPISAASLKMGLLASCQPFFEAVKKGLDRVEALYLGKLMETHDANEGIRAFMEKRKPSWQNR